MLSTRENCGLLIVSLCCSLRLFERWDAEFARRVTLEWQRCSHCPSRAPWRAMPFSSFETFTVILLWPQSCRSTDSQTVLGVKYGPWISLDCHRYQLLSHKRHFFPKKFQSINLNPLNQSLERILFTFYFLSLHIIFFYWINGFYTCVLNTRKINFILWQSILKGLFFSLCCMTINSPLCDVAEK